MKAASIRRRYGRGTKSIISIPEIARQFDLSGDFDSADVLGSGHIHETFLLASSDDNIHRRYVLQHLNQNVFRDPEAVMSNVARIVEHIRRKTQQDETAVRSLILVPTTDGEPFYKDDTGEFWRVYDYIDGAETIDKVESAAQASEAAAAFGQFQDLLRDLPAPPLKEVIPDFHNTPARFRQFEETLQRDEHNRAQLCQPEIEAVQRYAETADELIALQESGEIPQRIVHNDTKINNLMFDTETGRAVCVIDLDTVMPGLVLYDFGDLVRTATMPVDEDERDLSAVHLRIDIFKALVDGYLSSAGGFLNAAELACLHRCGHTITIETGVRFLTDYLDGDQYFKVDRLYQNLDRCRAQFALARSIDEQAEAMQEIVTTAAQQASLATRE